jgi:hypothetical protein
MTWTVVTAADETRSKREFRGYWDQTIADAGDTEATLHAMAAEILRYRHVGHVRLRCLLTLLSLWVGQPWANCRSRLTIRRFTSPTRRAALWPPSGPACRSLR